MPFAITIDYQTVEDSTATLRERDSTAQVREEGWGQEWAACWAVGADRCTACMLHLAAPIERGVRRTGCSNADPSDRLHLALPSSHPRCACRWLSCRAWCGG